MEELDTYKRDIYSQNGEDGIIAEILRRLSLQIDLDRWCVEFGAWDGVHLSNTCRLIREENYNAVLIEGSKKRSGILQTNFPQSNVVKLCKFITFDGPDSLENTLKTTAIPIQFDFLSIDVDGVDYHILESLQEFRPKVICIEFNPTIPNAVDFVQQRDMRLKQGSSARALVRLAGAKGYSLVALTQCNLLFVRSDLAALVCETGTDLEDIYSAGNEPTFLFVGYDGSLLSNKDSIDLAWHGIAIPLDKLQFLPKYLRRFPGDYGLGGRLFLKVVILLKLPNRAAASLLRKLKNLRL